MISAFWDEPATPRGEVSYAITVEHMDMATGDVFPQENFNVTMPMFVLEIGDQYFVLYTVNVSAFTTAGSSVIVLDTCTTEEGGK